MHQTVELAELRCDGCGQSVVVGGRGARQVELGDRRLRRAERLDLIVQAIELRAVAAAEDDARARTRAFEGERAAQAAGGTRDQNRAAGEESRLGLEVFR